MLRSTESRDEVSETKINVGLLEMRGEERGEERERQGERSKIQAPTSKAQQPFYK